jgi:hypothetical protein
VGRHPNGVWVVELAAALSKAAWIAHQVAAEMGLTLPERGAPSPALVRQRPAISELQAELVRSGRYPLLVVDEMGDNRFEPETANLFFQLVLGQHSRPATSRADGSAAVRKGGQPAYQISLWRPRPRPWW